MEPNHRAVIFYSVLVAVALLSVAVYLVYTRGKMNESDSYYIIPANDNSPNQPTWLGVTTIPAVIVRTYTDQRASHQKYVAYMSVNETYKNCRCIFFTDHACLSYMNKYATKETLQAYDMLVPGAFKADIFRLVYLIREGGVYMDDCFNVNPECTIKLTDILDQRTDMVLVRDLPSSGGGIYQALIASKPGSPLLAFVLDQIVQDVLAKRAVTECLDLTGPRAFARHLATYTAAQSTQIVWLELVQCDEELYIEDGQSRKLFKTKYTNWRLDRESRRHKHYSTIPFADYYKN